MKRITNPNKMDFVRNGERAMKKEDRDIIKEQKKKYFCRAFNYWLDVWKKRTKKTDRDFARKIIVSKNMITFWRKGTVFPQKETLQKIANEFNIPESFLAPEEGIELDYTENSAAIERSKELQEYAICEGLKESTYQFLTSMPDFLATFPFHYEEVAYEYNHLYGDEDNPFPLVKFQFEDDNKVRRMLSEEDIDFMIQLQNGEILAAARRAFYWEKLKLLKKRQRKQIEKLLRYYDLKSEDVYTWLNKVDFLQPDSIKTPLLDDELEESIKALAESQGVTPQISYSELEERSKGEEDVLRTLIEMYKGKGYTIQGLSE